MLYRLALIPKTDFVKELEVFKGFQTSSSIPIVHLTVKRVPLLCLLPYPKTS